jgi:hypothetical protein
MRLAGTHGAGATGQVSPMYDALAILGEDGQSGGGVRRLKRERPVGTMVVVVTRTPVLR